MFAPLFHLQGTLTANLGAVINFFLNIASNLNLLTHPCLLFFWQACPPFSGGPVRLPDWLWQAGWFLAE